MIPLSFVRAALDGARVDLSSEKAAQAGLTSILKERLQGVNVEREVRLGSGDIVDILVDGQHVVEVKLRGAPKMAVFRQLRRYAVHATVSGLLLASNMAIGLPDLIESKPALFVGLGAVWR